MTITERQLSIFRNSENRRTDYKIIKPLLFIKRKKKKTGILKVRLVSKPKQSTHFVYTPHTDVPRLIK